MFKKAVDAKSHQRLSGGDRKKLRRTIRERFSNASDSLVDLLLPPKVTFLLFGYLIFIELHWNKVPFYCHAGGVSCFEIPKSGTRLCLGGRLSHLLWRRWARSPYIPYRSAIYLFPTPLFFWLRDGLDWSKPVQIPPLTTNCPFPVKLLNFWPTTHKFKCSFIQLQLEIDIQRSRA